MAGNQTSVSSDSSLIRRCCKRKEVFRVYADNDGIRVARQLAFLTSDHKVLSLNLTRGGIQLIIVWRFIA